MNFTPKDSLNWPESVYELMLEDEDNVGVY